MAPRQNTRAQAQPRQDAPPPVMEGEVMDDASTPLGQALTAMNETQSLAMSLTRAEIDQQIATAKRYPRSIQEAKRRIETLATLTPEAAAAAIYVLERKDRDGKVTQIIGPSIRYAELVFQSWHNCRVAARVTDVGKDSVEATGIFHDLEANVAVAKAARRSIKTRSGARYGDDMINVTSNAAASVALRNAILAGIPRAVWGEGFQKALSVTRGTAETLNDRKGKMVQAFKANGASQAQVWQLLGVKGEADVTLDHMVIAAGLLNRLADGEALADLLEEVGPAPAQSGPSLSQANGKATADLAKNANAAREGGRPVSEKDAKPPAEQVDPQTGEVTTPEKTAQEATEQSGGTTPAAKSDQGPADAPQGQGDGGNAAGGAGAQTVDSKPASPASATDASSDTPQAAEASGQNESSTQPDAGAAADEHLANMDAADEFEASQDQPEDDGGSTQAPPEVTAYVAAINAAEDWDSVKAALGALLRTDAWKGMGAEQQRVLYALAWSHVTTMLEPAAQPNPAKDPPAFRLFMSHSKDADAISRVWNDLIASAAWQKSPDGLKQSLMAGRKDRLAQLKEQSNGPQ